MKRTSRLGLIAGAVLIIILLAAFWLNLPSPTPAFVPSTMDAYAVDASAVDVSSVSPSAPSPSSSPSKPPPPASVKSKKGVCVWEAEGLATAIKDVRASWYYNWSAHPPVNAGPTAEFVPMIWGANAVNATELNRAKASGKTLLGFNEPDFTSQANLTVEKALDLWPQLQATGLRLGSPAVATKAADTGSWLDRFLKGANDRGLRVDFLTIHWYGADFSDAAAGQLKNYLQAVWDKYRLPIWLTEFALIKFTSGGSVYPTDAQQANFVTKATIMLNGLSYVERYAWFALPMPKEGHQGTALYKGTVPTPAGAAYKSAT